MKRLLFLLVCFLAMTTAEAQISKATTDYSIDTGVTLKTGAKTITAPILGKVLKTITKADSTNLSVAALKAQMDSAAHRAKIKTDSTGGWVKIKADSNTHWAKIKADSALLRAKIKTDSTALAAAIASGGGGPVATGDSTASKVVLASQSFYSGAAFAIPGASIYMFGNSILAGQNSTNRYYDWGAVFSRSMALKSYNYAIGGSRLYNNADTNNTSYQIRHNLVAARDTNDWVLIAQGTNDVTANDSVSYRDTLISLITFIKTKGYISSHIIVVGCYPWPGHEAGVSVNSRASKAGATNQNTLFIEMDSTVNSYGAAQYIDIDGIHYNDLGHSKLAQVAVDQMVLKYLIKMPGTVTNYGDLNNYGKAIIKGSVDITGNVIIRQSKITSYPILSANINYNYHYSNNQVYTSIIDPTFADKGLYGNAVVNTYTGHAYFNGYDNAREQWPYYQDSTCMWCVTKAGNGSLRGNLDLRGNLRNGMIKAGAVSSINVTKNNNTIVFETYAYGDQTAVLPAAPDSGETHTFINFPYYAGIPSYKVIINPNGNGINGVGGNLDFWGRVITIMWNGYDWNILNPIDRVNSGSVSANGDGVATTFTVTHGFKITPSQVFVQPTSVTMGLYYVTNKTTTTFDVICITPPVVGTNNVTFDWSVR